MKSVLVLMACLTGVAMADETLLRQTELVHLHDAKGQRITQEIHVQVKQTKATPVRISGWVKSRSVVGVPGGGFGIVTNLNFAATPIFWDTLIFPETGTQPWRYAERLVHARLPIESIDLKFMLDRDGEAWFRDFKVEAIEPWEEQANAVVALLGDSTDMASYLPENMGVAYNLELLLRDRLPDRVVQVRNLAESGDWLGKLLSSGRLERELDTLPRCDVAIIRYGLNDNSKAEPPQFKQQLGETADRILKRFPNAKIAVATTLPPRGEKFEQATREFAAERKYALIDVAQQVRQREAKGDWDWRNAANMRIGLDHQSDPASWPKKPGAEIHPNAHGCRMIAQIELPVVESLLAPASPATTQPNPP